MGQYLIYKNVYEWPTVKRAVFMTDLGSGCIIVDKPKGKKAYLFNLNVSPTVRKNGIATSLMNAAEKWCTENGYESVTLAWDLKEAPYWVFDWYVRRGYEEVEMGNKCALLEKKLKSPKGKPTG